MIKRFYKINDDLYRGGAPSTGDVMDLHDRFGIRKIVSLDEMIGKKIDRQCNLLGIEHVIIPIDATKLEPIATLLNMDLHQLLIDGGPTFVHCFEGKDRTGMVIAMYDCKFNDISCDDALEKAKLLGFGLGVPPKITRFYEHAVRAYCGCPAPKDSKKDENNADIVDHTREFEGEWHDTYLDEADRKSFAPSQDPAISEYPYNVVNVNEGGYGYNPHDYPEYSGYDYAYSPTKSTREQPAETPITFEGNAAGATPLVGQYENDVGLHGVSPVELGGGFVNT